MRVFIIFFVVFSFFNIYSQSFGNKWVERFGNSYYDQGNAITSDNLGNIYIAGIFEGTVDFDFGVNTYSLGSPLFAQGIFILKLDSNSNFIWVKHFTGDSALHEVSSIKVDSLYNVYIGGSFAGTTDFDPSPNTYKLTAYDDGLDDFIYFDAFVAKLNPLGNLLWVKQFGGSSNDRCKGLTIDGDGCIYSTGEFQYTVDFDPGNPLFNLTAQSIDIFVTKLSSIGNLVWVKKMGGASVDGGTSITADKNANVYLTGLFQDTCDFDPGAGTANLIATAYYDAFILKLDSSGNFVWGKRVGGVGPFVANGGNSIHVDKSQNIILAGYFAGSGDFNPNAGIFMLNSAGFNDVFILKLDSSGNFIWVKSFGGSFDEAISSVTTDKFDNIYSIGWFQSNADFDPSSSTFTLNANGMSTDIFVSKLNSSGNLTWALNFGGSLIDRGQGIVSDNFGNIYTTGFFNGTADFDPNIGVISLLSSGGTDGFIQCLDELNSVGLSEQNELSLPLIIYPNPSKDRFQIQIIHPLDNNLILSITDCVGQIIYTNEKIEQDMVIDLDQFAAGIYFARISDNSKQKTYKLIKH